MSDYAEKLASACERLANARSILVGGGAGLSAAAGIDYSGPEFRREFADYIEKYGFPDLYSSGFHAFPTEGERWARWARHIDYARFRPPAMPLYKNLLRLIEGHQYFVITTNVDGQFKKAGFDPEKIFAVQGDYGRLQCQRGCHEKLYDNESLVAEMLAQWHDFAIPEELVPRCPVCGGAMSPHLRVDRNFVEDASWRRMARRYESFLRKNQGAMLVLIEAGVGFNTPGIIRLPFEDICRANPNAFLIRLNGGNAWTPADLRGRSIGFNEDMTTVIGDMLENMQARP